MTGEKFENLLFKKPYLLICLGQTWVFFSLVYFAPRVKIRKWSLSGLRRFAFIYFEGKALYFDGRDGVA